MALVPCTSREPCIIKNDQHDVVANDLLSNANSIYAAYSNIYLDTLSKSTVVH